MSEADTTIVVVPSLSHAGLLATPWTAAHQASLSFTISRSLLLLVCYCYSHLIDEKTEAESLAVVLQLVCVSPRTLYAEGRRVDASSCAVSQSLLRVPLHHNFSCLCLTGLVCTQQSRVMDCSRRQIQPQNACASKPLARGKFLQSSKSFHDINSSKLF